MDIRSPVFAILCGGAPAPGINGVISSLTIEALNSNCSVIGFFEGFKQLRAGRSMAMSIEFNDVTRIYNTGGSLLRTSKQQLVTAAHVDNCLRVLQHHRVRYLVTIGGTQTAYSASLLVSAAAAAKYKLSVVAVPKTIFNDISGACLLRGTLVALADGTSIPCEAVKQGDALLGVDGQIAVAEDDAESSTREEVWEVSHHDGSSYTVSAEHRLTLVNLRNPHFALQLDHACPEPQWRLKIEYMTPDGACCTTETAVDLPVSTDVEEDETESRDLLTDEDEITRLQMEHGANSVASADSVLLSPGAANTSVALTEQQEVLLRAKKEFYDQTPRSDFLMHGDLFELTPPGLLARWNQYQLDSETPFVSGVKVPLATAEDHPAQHSSLHWAAATSTPAVAAHAYTHIVLGDERYDEFADGDGASLVYVHHAPLDAAEGENTAAKCLTLRRVDQLRSRLGVTVSRLDGIVHHEMTHTSLDDEAAWRASIDQTLSLGASILVVFGGDRICRERWHTTLASYTNDGLLRNMRDFHVAGIRHITFEREAVSAAATAAASTSEPQWSTATIIFAPHATAWQTTRVVLRALALAHGVSVARADEAGRLFTSGARLRRVVPIPRGQDADPFVVTNISISGPTDASRRYLLADGVLTHNSSFGSSTAREVGSQLVQNFSNDARTMNRWYLIVCMGQKAGHLTLGIGKAGAATLTILAEDYAGRTTPLTFEELATTLEAAIYKRRAMNKEYGVACISEGLVSCFDAKEMTDRFGDLDTAHSELGRHLAADLARRFTKRGIDQTVVARNIGNELRSAPPNASDVTLTRDLGFAATRVLMDGGTNCLVTLKGGQIHIIPFSAILDPTHASTQIRRVETSSLSYQVAQSYSIVLRQPDLQDAGFLQKLARAANLTASEFLLQFQSIAAPMPLFRHPQTAGVSLSFMNSQLPPNAAAAASSQTQSGATGSATPTSALQAPVAQVTPRTQQQLSHPTPSSTHIIAPGQPLRKDSDRDSSSAPPIHLQSSSGLATTVSSRTDFLSPAMSSLLPLSAGIVSPSSNWFHSSSLGLAAAQMQRLNSSSPTPSHMLTNPETPISLNSGGTPRVAFPAFLTPTGHAAAAAAVASAASHAAAAAGGGASGTPSLGSAAAPHTPNGVATPSMPTPSFGSISAAGTPQIGSMRAATPQRKSSFEFKLM